MKKYSLKILGLVCIFPFITAHAAMNAGDKVITKTVTDWMKSNNAPGVAVEIYNNGVPHSYYFGYANRQTKKPITGATIFEVGSLTQLFTSLLLAEEVNAGKAKLSDPMVSYLIDIASKPNSQVGAIALQNLATHTAGLPLNLPQKIKTQSDLNPYFSSWNPSSPVGSQWAYSNADVGLLGNALEVITHSSFNQMYRGEILRPLGMQPIGIIVSKQLMPNYAQGYNASGTTVLQSSANDLFPASDDIKVSVHDMLQFLKAAIGLPGVPATITNAMQVAQTPYVKTQDMEQGLGWNIYPAAEANKLKLLSSSEINEGPISAQQLNKDQQQFDNTALIDGVGTAEGFSTYIALIPNEKSGIVILTNSNVPSSEITKLGRQILLSPN